MPTYEYICTACANEWEEMQKISEPALTDCPKCGQPTAKRQISAGNFILKGGGWYADLYSSSPKKADSSGSGDSASSTKSESKSEGASSGSSESSSPKTETKTETKPAAAPAKDTTSKS